MNFKNNDKFNNNSEVIDFSAILSKFNGGVRNNIDKQENDNQAQHEKRSDPDRDLERLQLVARFEAMQNSLRMEISKNPQVAKHVPSAILSADVSKMTSGEIMGLIGTMTSEAKEAEVESDNNSVIAAAIKSLLVGCAKIFSSKHCHNGELMDNHNGGLVNTKLVNANFHELGNLHPTMTDIATINQMAILLDKNYKQSSNASMIT